MAAVGTVTAISDALKTVYVDILYKQIFEKNILEKSLRKGVGVMTSDGKAVTFKHQYGRNGGVGSIALGGKLPNAGVESYKESTLQMKQTFGTLWMDDFSIDATKSKKASIVSLLNSQMEGIKDSMRRAIARQWYSVGSGEICKLSAAVSASATIIVDSPMAGPEATWFLEEDQYVYIDEGTTAAASGNVRKINSVDSATQFTVDAAITSVDNDVVALAQVDGTSYATSHILGGAAGTEKEMYGLKGLVDDGTELGTVQGIVRSTYPWFNAYVSENSGTLRPVTETLMNDVHRNVEKYGTVKLIITTHPVFDAYGETLLNDRRYVNKLELAGGFTGLKFKNAVIVADWDCPVNTMYFLDTSCLAIEELTGMTWMDKDGSALYRAEDNTASYKATLKYYSNLGITKPRGTGVLKDVE